MHEKSEMSFIDERPIDVAREALRRAFKRVHCLESLKRRDPIRFKAAIEQLEGKIAMSDVLPVATIAAATDTSVFPVDTMAAAVDTSILVPAAAQAPDPPPAQLPSPGLAPAWINDGEIRQVIDNAIDQAIPRVGVGPGGAILPAAPAANPVVPAGGQFPLWPDGPIVGPVAGVQIPVAGNPFPALPPAVPVIPIPDAQDVPVVPINPALADANAQPTDGDPYPAEAMPLDLLS